MIVYPSNWDTITKYPTTEDLIYSIKQAVTEIDCPHLALSGGVDSTILLYIMANIYSHICAYTIASSENHPDVIFSAIAASSKPNVSHYIFISEDTSCDTHGNKIVERFFDYVCRYTNRIVCGDGIDEFTCGYYDHQRNGVKSYYDFIQRLNIEQLEPLNKSSGNVSVYLPYLNSNVVAMLQLIPIYDKYNSVDRKLPMINIAKNLGINEDIIYRWKYGFCDAFKVKK